MEDKEKSIANDLADIHTTQRRAEEVIAKKEHHVMLELSDIYEYRFRLLDEEYCQKPSRFAGYVRMRFNENKSREEDPAFYVLSYKLAKVSALLAEHPQLKEGFTVQVVAEERAEARQKYAIANLPKKVTILAGKPKKYRTSTLNTMGKVIFSQTS